MQGMVAGHAVHARSLSELARTLTLMALLGCVAPFARETAIAAAATAPHGASAKPAAPAMARPIDSPAAAGSRFPDLSALSDGRVLMSWYEPNGHATALRFAIFDGAKWSAPTTVVSGESLMVNGADVPSVRSAGGTRLVAHWLWQSGRGEKAYDVRLAQSADGGRTWSAPMTPHRDATASEHGFVSLIPAADGTLAIWLDGRNTVPHAGQASETMLRSATLTASGELRDESELDARTCDCCPTAAVATDRGVVVAYRDRDAGEIRDVSVTCRENGRWSSPQVVHADGWHIAGCPVNGPALAARGSRVALAWFTAAHDSSRVQVAFSDDGGVKFGGALRIDDGKPTGRVQVAWLDDGEAVVAWMESSGEHIVLRSRRLSVSGAPGAAITVAKFAQSRGVGFPRMVHSGKGLMFAWTEPGKPAHVRVARVD
jgi:hypothetical protein